MNRSSNSGNSVEEVPFDRVVRESEAASIPQKSIAADAAPIINTAQFDSLRLEITTHRFSLDQYSH